MVHALCFSIIRAKGSREKVTLANRNHFIMQIMLDNSSFDDMFEMDRADSCVV